MSSNNNNDDLSGNEEDALLEAENQPQFRHNSNRLINNNNNDEDIDEDESHGEGYSSVDAIIDALGFGTFQWRLLILCGLGAFSIALTHAMKSFLMPILKEYWKLKHWHLALMNSADLLGMIIGSIVLGRMADKLGRRPVYLFCLTFSGIFGIVSALATNFWIFVVLRGLLGVTFGAGIVINIVILAEVLPVQNRGYYLAIVSIFHAGGHLMCVALAWLLIPRIGWRLFVVVTGIPPLVIPFFQYYIPESARFILLRNTPDANSRAIQLLMRIADDNDAEPDVKQRISKSMLKRRSVETREAADLENYFRLFTHPMLGKITFVVALIWFVQSIAGVIVVWLPLYVAENQSLHVKQHGHMHMNKAYAAALLTGIGGLVGTGVFTRIMELFDRRRLLGAGYILITMCSISLAFLHSAAPILVLLPILSALEKGLLAVLNVYTPELYPTVVRTTAMGIMNAFQRFGMALGHWIVGALMKHSFLLLCMVISGLYLTSFIVVANLSYDTRGKRLADAYYGRLRKEKRWGCGFLTC